LRARGSKKPALSTTHPNPTEDQTNAHRLSSIDLATINAAQGVIVAAIRNQCCQWEQESADAVADGRLSNAVMVQHWAFAADILATTVSSEFSALFIGSLDARFGDLTSTTHRSAANQVGDAIALEVAAAQEAPELVAA
jgi:hypothetical protein